jgi:hypothetical protein
VGVAGDFGIRRRPAVVDSGHEVPETDGSLAAAERHGHDRRHGREEKE